jgi:sulfoxide reductase heme-binding subunit YedZ
VHLSAYAVFALSVAHGLGMGTDAGEPWSVAVTAASVGLVLVATGARVVVLRRAPLAGVAR